MPDGAQQEISARIHRSTIEAKKGDLEAATSELWNLQSYLSAERNNIRRIWLASNHLTFQLLLKLTAELDGFADDFTERYAVRRRALAALITDSWSLIEDVIVRPHISLIAAMKDIFIGFQRDKSNYTEVAERKWVYQDIKLGGPIYFAKAESDETFIVSQGFLEDKMIYFDFWNSPDEKVWLANLYKIQIEHIEDLMHENINDLLIPKKTRGPAGTETIKSELGQALPGKSINIQVIENKLGTEQENRTAAIIYDLLGTGRMLTRLIEQTKERTKEKIIANVVLYKLNGRDVYRRQRMAGVENMTYPIFAGDKMKEAYENGKRLPDTHVQVSLNQTVEDIITRKDSEALDRLLNIEQDGTLDILYQKAFLGELDLKQKQTKELWTVVLKHFSQDPRQFEDVTFKLASIYKSSVREACESFLETIAVGVGSVYYSGSLFGGYEVGQKVKRHFQRHDKQSILKTIEYQA